MTDSIPPVTFVALAIDLLNGLQGEGMTVQLVGRVLRDRQRMRMMVEAAQIDPDVIDPGRRSCDESQLASEVLNRLKLSQEPADAPDKNDDEIFTSASPPSVASEQDDDSE